MEAKKITAAILMVFVLIIGLTCSSQIWETLEPDEIMVIQAPWTGTQTWYTTQGTKWQWFGTVTKYPKRSQLWFSAKGNQGSKADESLHLQFNDNGSAQVSGSVSWEMPTDEDHLNLIHAKFHSAENIEHQLLKTHLEKVVYLTGPMMSSTESVSSLRAQLLASIEDQFLRGIYTTTTKDERTVDPLTNQGKTVKIVQIVQDTKTGEPKRLDPSPLEDFGIKAFNMTMNGIKYDPKVEAQISAQQESIMAVQTAIAETKTAEQKALTVAAKGQAEAAEAEWKQKVLTATATQEAIQKKEVALTEADQKKQVALTEAQQKLEVAQMGAQEAEQIKLTAILKGEGEASARKLIMDADGGMEQKLQAYVRVSEVMSEALKGSQWVPTVTFSSGGGSNTGATTTTTGNATSNNGFTQFFDLLNARTAHDLALDIKIPEKSGNLPEIKRPEISKFKFDPSSSGQKKITIPLKPMATSEQ
jgi:regulator of protease activity HflC (stomatin/prohibitin superfamily)